jgi:hypothetical protein
MAGRHPRPGGRLAAVVVAGVLLAACGSSTPAAAAHSASSTSSTHSSSSSASNSTTTSSTTAPSSSQSAASEAAFASRVNLTASDLPAGWGAMNQTAGQTTLQPGQPSAVKACSESSDTHVTKIVSSPLFANFGASATGSPYPSMSAAGAGSPGAGAPYAVTIPAEVVSIVEFLQPSSRAPSAAAAFASPTGIECLKRTLQRQNVDRSGGKFALTDISATGSTTSAAGTSVGEVKLSYTESITAGSFSTHEPVHELLAVFAKGGALIDLSGINLPASDQSLFDGLLAKLVARA